VTVTANNLVIETLNALIETNRDAEQGFRTAADAVSDPAIKRLFGAYARQRAEFSKELDDEVQRLGGTPQRRGSVSGSLHRALMNLRAAVSGRQEDAVIAEAERGDDVAVATYEQALRDAGLPADVRGVIMRQAALVKEAHARLSDLKRAA